MGDQRGRLLGFPTANVEVPNQVCLPADGVYAGWYERPDGEIHPCAINLGRRPTFYEHADHSLLEAHLLDFDGDLYGERAEVRFTHFLRSERKFDGIDALVAQLKHDIEHARDLMTGDDARSIDDTGVSWPGKMTMPSSAYTGARIDASMSPSPAVSHRRRTADLGVGVDLVLQHAGSGTPIGVPSGVESTIAPTRSPTGTLALGRQEVRVAVAVDQLDGDRRCRVGIGDGVVQTRIAARMKSCAASGARSRNVRFV